MDDLDHSMHIAEFDWSSFYEESEECGLLQPSLACPDHISFSDSEDLGNSSSGFNVGLQEHKQSTDSEINSVECRAAPWYMKTVQTDLNSSGEEQDDSKYEEEGDTQVNYETILNNPEGCTTNAEAGHTTKDTNDDVTATQQTEQINVQPSDKGAVKLKNNNGDLQTESDTCDLKPIQKADPLSFYQPEQDVSEPHTADRAESQDVSSVALRAERERWFVTVNDSPARQRVRTPSGKKKRRQKRPYKDGHMCRAIQLEKLVEKGFRSVENRDYNESEGGEDISDGHPNAEQNYERIQEGVSDLSQISSTSGEEDNLSEKLVISEHFSLHDIFTPKGPSRFDSVESEDSSDFFSTHSYESESYLSAAESIEDPQLLLTDNQSIQSSVSLAKNSWPCNLSEITHPDNTQVIEMHPYDSTFSSNETALSSEGHENTTVGPTQTSPSVGQNVNKTPDDDSACINDTHSTLPCESSDTPGLQQHEINRASAFSSGDQLSLLSVPDLTITPCSVEDSPETYAKAAGNTRPVFAISAFWDEMEKLTINDILQLRIGRSSPPRETQETASPNVDDFLVNPSSSSETMEYSLSNGVSVDMSDTADSDYFTQIDESKPDRSSCEFSTSDFEEEYWQFLGASRNPSPDPQSRNQQGTCDSSFFEEEESICSEGKETPVPSEDFAGQIVEDQDPNAFSPCELAWPRQLTKSKSVCNVPALNKEDSSLQLLLTPDENSLFLSSCPSLEENMTFDISDILPVPILSNTDEFDELSQTSFPEVFEYLFNDQTKTDSCVAVYDPDDIPSVPVFDTLYTIRDEMSFSSLRDSQCKDNQLIPIFSCSHPTVQELTFPHPKYVFLSSDDKEAGAISPVRVVSHSLLLGRNFETSAVAFSGLPSLLSIRKIRFSDKGSIWCGSSGAWVFPVGATNETIEGKDPPLTSLTRRSLPKSPSQLFRELALQPGILETIQTTRREGIFSALKQSDMCLVCIAFASWVLRSSDPEAADTWKAALLANVSALSAIQYLRHYVKKKTSQDHP